MTVADLVSYEDCEGDHGYACCGCARHPIGKPWGWNAEEWNRHWASEHAATPRA